MLQRIKGLPAIIYGRFSSRKQLEGGSIDRQIANAEAFAKKHDLKLDLEATCFDEGLSGFHGEHKRKGALGILLERAKAGLITKGTVLLVEDVDRLSRQEPMEALTQLQTLVSAGISIVTVSDGQLFDQVRLRSDISALFILIGNMHRAHDESRIKAERTKSNWKQIEEKAKRGEKVNVKAPFWIDGSTSLLIPDKADVIRRIFKLYQEGFGVAAIAKVFNSEDLPTPSGGKTWYSGNLNKLLSNEAVLGLWRGHKIWPQAIDGLTFQETQQLRATRRGTGGSRAKMRSALSGGLVKCKNCGGAISTRDTSKAKNTRVLYCTKSLNGDCENKKGILYRTAVLFSSYTSLTQIASISAERALQTETESNTAPDLETELAGIGTQLKRLTQLSMMTDDIETIADEMNRLNERKKEITNKLNVILCGGKEGDLFEESTSWLYNEGPALVSRVIDADNDAAYEWSTFLKKLGVSFELFDGALCYGEQQIRTDGKRKHSAVVETQEGLLLGSIIKTDDGTLEVADGYWWRAKTND